jgi:hypothetical protein
VENELFSEQMSKTMSKSTYMVLGISELSKGGHTVGSDGTGSKEANLEVGLACGSRSSDKCSMITASRCQQTGLEEKPLQNGDGVGFAEQTQLRRHAHSLLWRFERNDCSWVILQILSDIRIVVNNRDAMLLKMLCWANSAAHKDLRRSNSTPCNNNFATGVEARLKPLNLQKGKNKMF